MEPRTDDRDDTRLTAGRDALRRGRWEEARERFREVLRDGEDASALEGLSWAAWWLDDADEVFACRERAFALHRGSGDLAAAARMAIWLASDELDFHGAVAVASGWLRRAHRLLEDAEPCAEHGWLAFLDGYLARVRGDVEGSARLARVAAETGRRLDVLDLEVLGLALEGSALVVRGEVDDGMRALDEAAATALDGTPEIPISGAWACCFLVGACESVRDFARAREWCEHIADFAERYGSRYMLAFCRAEYGAVHLWTGRWSEADEVLTASIEDFTRSRPAMAGGPLAALAELRRRQGRAEESEALLERAGSSAASQLCRARIALDGGDADRATELVERALRQTAAHDRLSRVPALELLVASRSATGDLDGARESAAALRELADESGTDALRASADVAEGRVAAALGDHERARRLFEDSVDRLERAGGVFEAARARQLLAASLRSLGRDAGAREESAAAARQLAALGAADATSAAGRGDVLTPREREVVALVADGLTNREIAERLVVSEHTVHRHVANLMRKLGASSRTAAATTAHRRGLLTDRG